MAIDGHDSVQRRDESVNPSLIDSFVPTSNVSGHRLVYGDLRTPYCTVEFTTACNSHHTVWTAHIWRSENSILRSGIHVSM